MENIKLNELKRLYKNQSKHSSYQILSNRLSALLNWKELNIKTRYESERLSFIIKNIDIYRKTILDIGGNTGYFSFELIENGAKYIHYYEGNKIHSDFVKLASSILNVESQIHISNKYYSVKDKLIGIYDIVLLLNILHHIGDDFGPKKITIEEAKKEILLILNSLSQRTIWLVFQMGFNWKGDKNLGLFKNGTKAELIEFIERGTKNNWEITRIGIPERINDNITYCEMNSINLKRDDTIGEFLNRPIFILKSKHA